MDESTGIAKTDPEEKSVIDEDALCTEIDDNFRMAFEAKKSWAEEAEEDIDFANGKQWTDDEKAKLESQGRPALTFNKIKPIIKLLTGHMLQNSARLEVNPEGGEDQKFSEVMDNLIDHIDESTQLEFNMGYMFSGAQKAGRSWIEFYHDYDDDPIFGQLKSIYHGPFMIYDDPRGTAYDLSDREFCFKIVKRTKSELKELYPKKKDKIDELSLDTEDVEDGMVIKEGDSNNYGIGSGSKVGINATASGFEPKEPQKQYTVKEYWRIKRSEKFCVYFLDKGDMPKFDTEDQAQAEIAKRQAAFIEAGNPPELFKHKLVKRKAREMHVAIKVGGVILEDGKSPMEPYYHGFPFFQYIADWSPEAKDEKERVMGIVRSLKDPQREKNKSRSQFLHILGTSANSGWLGDEEALTDAQWSELKNFGSTPGLTVRKKKGAQLERIQPVAPDLASQAREKAATDDFKEVSGINSDLLAVDQSANPSGKAIALRIRQAITILETDFRNLRYTKKLIGEFLFKVIPTLFDVTKMKKVLGQNFIKENQVEDNLLKTFLIMIEDGKYNVRVAEQGNTKTMREETLEDLMNMVSNGMQIPFEVIADFMTFPNKTEVLNKVKMHQQQQQNAAIAMEAAKKGAASPSNGAPPSLAGMAQ